MEQLINLMSTLSQNKQEQPKQTIPKEILDQYPYGDFPIKYTKTGQETIRINSQNRFSYQEDIPQNTEEKDNTSLDLNSLLPLIQILSNKTHSQKDMLQVFSKILFKDHPEMESLLKLFSTNQNKDINTQEINNTKNFPDTNKVSISSLKRVDK